MRHGVKRAGHAADLLAGATGVVQRRFVHAQGRRPGRALAGALAGSRWPGFGRPSPCSGAFVLPLRLGGNRGMMKTQRVCWRRVLALACTVGAVPHALAQMADSTHVVGLAPQGVPPAGAAPGGPMSSQQMLNAMQGAELYFREYTDYRSGYAHLPAFVRVKVFADRAELQFHQWEAGWQRQCPVTPERPICQENQHNQPGIMKLQLMPN